MNDTRPGPVSPGAAPLVDLSAGYGTPSASASGDMGKPGTGGPGCLEWEYRWAKMAARTDSPRPSDLEADGWELDSVDVRYGTELWRRCVTHRYDAAVRGVELILAAIAILAIILVCVDGWNNIVKDARTDTGAYGER